MDTFYDITTEWKWCEDIPRGTDPRECIEPNPDPCPYHEYKSHHLDWYCEYEYIEEEDDIGRTENKKHQVCRWNCEQHSAPYKGCCCLMKSGSPSARLGHFQTQHFAGCPELEKGVWGAVWFRLSLKRIQTGSLHNQGLSAPPPVASISSHGTSQPQHPQSLPPIPSSSATNISIGVNPANPSNRDRSTTETLHLPMDSDNNSESKEEEANADFDAKIDKLNLFKHKHGNETGTIRTTHNKIKTGSTPHIPLTHNLINNVYYRSVIRADPSCISHSHARAMVSRRYC